MGHVFLSYSRADAAVADRIIHALSTQGIAVWVDRTGIPGGAQWRSQIVEALDRSDGFMVLLSPRSVQSENVRKELDLAEDKKKRIVPVAIEPCDIPNDMAYQLAGLQRVSLFPNFDASMAELRHALTRARSRAAATGGSAVEAIPSPSADAGGADQPAANSHVSAPPDTGRAGLDARDPLGALVPPSGASASLSRASAPPAGAAPAPLTPWDDLPQAERDKVSRFIALLHRGDFARLRVACLGTSAAHPAAAPLMRAMREFCTGILKVKLDISADNRAEIDAGLKEALAAFDRPAGLYETYATTLRPGAVDVAAVLTSVARSAEMRRQVLDSVRSFATSRRDNALMRELDKFNS